MSGRVVRPPTVYQRVLDELKQAERSLLRVEREVERSGEFDRWEGCAVDVQRARDAVTSLIERMSQVPG